MKLDVYLHMFNAQREAALRYANSTDAATEHYDFVDAYDAKLIELVTESTIADACIADVVFRFIDRMNDIAPPEDSAERILSEFVAAVQPAINMRIDVMRKHVTCSPAGWESDKTPVQGKLPRACTCGTERRKALCAHKHECVDIVAHEGR